MIETFEFLASAARALVAILYLSPEVPPARAAEFSICVMQASIEKDVPWERIVAVVKHESGWKEKAIGRTADFGLGQIHCPGPFCKKKKPSKKELSKLLDGCTNLRYTAHILARGLKWYNPGNPEHKVRVTKVESRVRRMFSKKEKRWRASRVRN